jgi:MRG
MSVEDADSQGLDDKSNFIGDTGTTDSANIIGDHQPHDVESNDDLTIPNPKFQVHQKVFARDKDGVLYLAVVRRQLYGPQYHRQVEMGFVSSAEEAQELLDYEPSPDWHFFVHYNKWNVKFDRWVTQIDLYDITDDTTAYATKIAKEHRELHIHMRKHTTNRKPSHTVDGAAFLREWKKRIDRLEKEFKSGQSDKPMASSADIAPFEPREPRSKKVKWTTSKLVKECNLREHGLTGKRPQNVSNVIILPFTLKKVLVQQWEIINQCNMVSCLPAPTTIRQVLDMYLESKNVVVKSSYSSVAKEANGHSMETNDNVDNSSSSPELSAASSGMADTLTENVECATDNVDREMEWNIMADGIAMLFDEALPSGLLYEAESAQYQILQSLPEFQKNDSKIFGCEHLIRLFVKLPEMLEDKLSDVETRPLLAKVNDFIRFLDKNHGIVFTQSHRKLNDLELKEQQKQAKQGEKKRSVPADGTRTETESAKKKDR